VKSQRILIYRLGSLGDTVVALPCFHKIAQTWPDAERIVLTNFPVNSTAAGLETILRPSELIHGTIAYPVGTRSLNCLLDLAKRIRKLQPDVLVYLTAPRGLAAALRDWLFFKSCGIKHIVGTPFAARLQTGCRVNFPVSQGGGHEEHECERLARCLHALGPINLDDPCMWDLRLTAREIQAGERALSPLTCTRYFAISMGGKSKEKDWSLNNWTLLLSRLTRQYPNTGLVIVGAAEDSARAQLVARTWSGAVLDLCGTLTPRECAAAMRHAIAFIGHDSGPLHLAAAAGVRCVGLFGNFNRPRRWHPRGAQHRIIHRMDGLDGITVAEVIAAVREVVLTASRGRLSPAPIEVPGFQDQLRRTVPCGN
jgi:ADP-heptose:LPS heptosyltransferase